MNLSKATMKCPVCGTQNETNEIHISQEAGILQSNTFVRLNFYCPECETRHTEEINIEAARRKLGEAFLKITEYERSGSNDKSRI